MEDLGEDPFLCLDRVFAAVGESHDRPPDRSWKLLENGQSAQLVSRRQVVMKRDQGTVVGHAGSLLAIVSHIILQTDHGICLLIRLTPTNGGRLGHSGLLVN